MITTCDSEEPSAAAPAGSREGCSDSQIAPPRSSEPAGRPSPSPAFPRLPGETPRAFSAFMAYFQLGQHRSLPAVADKLGESLGTVKNWSSKYDWTERLQSYYSGLLQEQVRLQTASDLQQAADWNHRLQAFREQEWEAAQKLIAAAQCFLETCGEEEVRQMTLAQASRALKISSAIARSAITGAVLPESPEAEESPLQQQLLAGLERVYGQPDSAPKLDSSLGTSQS